MLIEQRARLLHGIARFADDFRSDYLSEYVSIRDDMRSNWLLALRFFFGRSFYRGRRNELSKRFEDAAWQVVEDTVGRDPECAAEALMQLQAEGATRFLPRGHGAAGGLADRLRDGGASNEKDVRMVCGVLGWATELPENNIVRHAIGRIEAGEIRELDGELQSLHEIGPKISSLVLRDVVDVYGLGHLLREEDAVLLQAVDTWVEQVCGRVGIAGTDLRAAIVRECKEFGVDPIDFNMGVYYVGAHSLDVVLLLLTEEAEQH